MILKAGTYRFKDTINLYDTLNIVFNFTYELSSEGLTATFYCSRMYYELNSKGLPTLYYTVPQIDMGEGIVEWGADTLAYVVGSAGEYNEGWQQGEVGYPTKTVTIHKDVEVDDVGGNWFIASTNYNEVNAKPLAEITYNGETIGQLNAGETATLSCKDKKMASDVVVKVNEVESKIPEGYVKPEGTLQVVSNNTTVDVTNYAKIAVRTAKPREIETESQFNAILSDSSGITGTSAGDVFMYIGETTDSYENGALYYLEDTEK